MSSGQRVIKYIAIAFGVFLVINIASAIIFGVSIFFGTFSASLFPSQEFSNVENEKMQKVEFDGSSVKNLQIDSEISKLTVVSGDKLEVAYRQQADKIDIKNENGTLTIKNKARKKWFNYKESEIILTIPTEKEYEKVEITLGVGDTKIENLKAKTLRLETGVGNLNADGLIVTGTAKVKAGVGDTRIYSSELANLDLDGGVGNFQYEGILTGTVKAHGGIGNLRLNLLGDKADYTFDIHTGIGQILYNGTKCKDDTVYGEGKHHIKLEGGVGNITIDTTNR